MIVFINADGRIIITDFDDFKRFSVKVDAPEKEYARISAATLPLVSFDNAETAWVDIDGLKAFAEFDDEFRLVAFDKMVAGAAPHGWISADGKAIKSHVMWQ